tara:strand:+ start:342 stop:662 length:321 start_codon:yes stop_codon:yes gene_type:complete
MPKKGLDKQNDIGVLDKQKNKVEPPKKYKVVLYNDDYTPMDFVSQLLMQIFHKDAITAKAITHIVHNGGKGIAGVYSREIAETKTQESLAVAQNYGHPLLVEFEPE